VNALQIQPLAIKPIVSKAESDKARALRIARIARQVREGTYYVSGRDIAAKLIVREAAFSCST